MHDAFAVVANVTLPVVPDGEPGADLQQAMADFTDSAEAWLSEGAGFFAFGSAGISREDYRTAYESYEAKRLQLNAAFRTVNSHLVDVCALTALKLYTTEGAPR